MAALAALFQRDLVSEHLLELSKSLAVSTGSLARLDVGWCHDSCAWCFPMRNDQGEVLGIRLRRRDGSKFAIKGGREGLFIPRDDRKGGSRERLLICEGPTDVAALLDLGFPRVVGRPSCQGGVQLLVALARALQPPEAVIASDGDIPGQRGAELLVRELVGHVPQVRVVRPPEGIKDMRDWVKAGATAEEIEARIGAAPVHGLEIQLVGAARR